MNGLRIETPSRLHFGLFGWGADAPRQFGGVGLMIDAPGMSLSARRSSGWKAHGPLGERVLKFARQVEEAISIDGESTPTLEFEVHRAPAEHVGLGTGTQLGLAVARLILELSGRERVATERLAKLVTRGRRSGIGLHGFDRGGVIIDGGRARGAGVFATEDAPIPPLLAHIDFPPDWAVLVVIPEASTGLHGPDEIEAFRRLPAVPEAVCDRICRLVLLGLLPALVERNLDGFGGALEELQLCVGECFAPEQGGVYAGPQSELIADAMKAEKLVGVGQSSWGPTLYGFLDADADERTRIADRLRERLGLDASRLFWTKANRGGARMRAADPHPAPSGARM
jgi:beta-ribofuranosylaminobenzene 5'-phosphate synthase